MLKTMANSSVIYDNLLDYNNNGEDYSLWSQAAFTLDNMIIIGNVGQYVGGPCSYSPLCVLVVVVLAAHFKLNHCHSRMNFG